MITHKVLSYYTIENLRSLFLFDTHPYTPYTIHPIHTIPPNAYHSRQS